MKAKNQPVKGKIIPQKLLDNIPDLTKFKASDYLFTPTSIGGEWEVSEASKRGLFTKRFKKVKDYFELSEDYGLYSFRHTAISAIYKVLEQDKQLTPSIIKSKLMLITGHSTMKALESYLRDIDAALPEDYSNLFKE